MQGKDIRGIAFICLFGCLGMFQSAANADMSLPNGQPLFTHAAYDYAPSIIYGGTVQKYWWCGQGTVPGTTFKTDVIFYCNYDVGTGQWSSILQVLAPTPGTWDGYFLCDPSVIRGQFLNPENLATYSYAMYYTATDDSAGRNNRIGIAYSNDGLAWVKLTHPVVYPATFPTTTYGAGQAATYSSDSKANIRIFYTDTTAALPSRTYTRRAQDGITFDSPIATSSSNNAGVTLTTASDYAYDYVSHYFYAVIETRPFRSGDRESYQFGLFRMQASNLFAGTGTWEALGFINTAKTGFDLNHNPALIPR